MNFGLITNEWIDELEVNNIDWKPKCDDSLVGQLMEWFWMQLVEREKEMEEILLWSAVLRLFGLSLWCTSDVIEDVYKDVYGPCSGVPQLFAFAFADLQSALYVSSLLSSIAFHPSSSVFSAPPTSFLIRRWLQFDSFALFQVDVEVSQFQRCYQRPPVCHFNHPQPVQLTGGISTPSAGCVSVGDPRRVRWVHSTGPLDLWRQNTMG